MLENQKLPDWKLTSLDETTPPNLSELKGKPILILFFNLGCPNCKSRAFPVAKKLADDYPDLQVVGIHTRFEGPEYSSRQIEEIKLVYQLNFPVWVDQGHQTFDLYEAGGTPHWTLINAEGMVMRNLFGSMPNTLQRLDYAMIELFEN